jgi:hypothetical protein
VKINNLDTCCEQVGRRGKDCETTRLVTKQAQMAHNFVNDEPKLIVALPGKFVAERSSYVSGADTKSSRPQI